MSLLTGLFGLLVVVILVVSIPVFFGGFGRKDKNKTSKNGDGHGIDKQFVRNKWLEINKIFRLGGGSNLKSSVMEADKLVDYVLVGKKISGNTMGERLKSAKKYFPNQADYNDLWFAHKVRNNIAHEATHQLGVGEAKRAMEYFEKSLKKLGAL
ncbi:MAG: hypothetical protein WCP14_01310 [bacterium]